MSTATTRTYRITLSPRLTANRAAQNAPNPLPAARQSPSTQFTLPEKANMARAGIM